MRDGEKFEKAVEIITVIIGCILVLGMVYAGMYGVVKEHERNGTVPFYYSERK